MKKTYQFPLIDVMILTESLMDSSNTSGIQMIGKQNVDVAGSFQFKQ